MLRFATVALVVGVLVFTAVGLAGRDEDISTGDTILVALIWGGPISAIIGVIVGLIWEKLIRPRRSQAAGSSERERERPAIPRLPEPRPRQAAARRRRHRGRHSGTR